MGITDDYRIHLRVRKLAHRRAANTDYFEILSRIRPDIRAAVIRDIEASTDASRKLKEKGKDKGKDKNAWRDKKQGKVNYGRGAAPEPYTDSAKKGKRWAKEDWIAWRKRLEEKKPDERSPAPDTSKGKEKEEKKSNSYLPYPLPGPSPA